jgi:hypothetical protein
VVKQRDKRGALMLSYPYRAYRLCELINLNYISVSIEHFARKLNEVTNVRIVGSLFDEKRSIDFSGGLQQTIVKAIRAV